MAVCECGEELGCGSVLTEDGNEIDYAECKECGVVEVMGFSIEITVIKTREQGDE